MITLCVIARNEEKLLPGCLESVKGVADQVIVVDTGSGDRTAEIAHVMGATVVEYKWCDDFSAARNAALPHVPKEEGSYLLILDADERLAPGAGEALKREAERGRIDLGLLTLHNARASTSTPENIVSGRERHGEPILLPRFIRWSEDLCWEGTIHENVESWLLRGGRKHGRIDASIIHYGGIPSERERLGKHARNVKLLRKHCAEYPDDGLMHARLAGELEDMGRTTEALEVAQRAWSIHVQDRFQVQMDRDPVMAATVFVFLLTKLGRRDQAAAVLEQAEELATNHPNFDLLRALLCELRFLEQPNANDPLVEAEHCLESCIEREGELFISPLLPGATSWAAGTRLGTVRLLLGKAREAAEAFQIALCMSPEHREALLGVAEARLRGGDATTAIKELEPLLQEPDPDAWFLIAQAADEIGAKKDARLFAETAVQALKVQGFVGSHRKLQLSKLEALLAG